MKVVLLFVFLAASQSIPTEHILPELHIETRSHFAALDELRLLANGLLQLGSSLSKINDIFQKLTIIDKSLNQLSVLTSYIKEEELKKTTVILKASNEKIRSLSLEIKSKVEDIINERKHLRTQVGGMEERLSSPSQSLLSVDQHAEIVTLKELIQTQEKSITDLLKTVNEQSEKLNNQGTKIKGLETKIGSAWIQETAENFERTLQPNSFSGYLPYYTSDGSFSSEGVFTVIQNRHDGSVDFDQSWEKYEDGFGDFSVHPGGHCLQLHHPPEAAVVEASSAVDEHIGLRFSTKDHNDGYLDPNCAQDYTGGWWYSICGDINLNGKRIQSRPRKKTTHWKPGKRTTSFKSSKISISDLTNPQTS